MCGALSAKDVIELFEIYLSLLPAKIVVLISYFTGTVNNISKLLNKITKLLMNYT